MGKYVVKVQRKGVIVIPAEIRRRYGIREGMEIIVIDDGLSIKLIPRVGLRQLYGIMRLRGGVP